MHVTQVVISGAGPTGLSLAAQLHRYGIDFIILDKKPGPTLLSKAVVVQARTLEIFDELGLAAKATERGRIASSFNMFYNGRRRLSLNVARMGQGLTAFPFVLSLEQRKNEMLLSEHLSIQGQKIHWNCEFIKYEENNGVDVYYRDAAGAEKIIHASYIVGCDGAGSPVRHQMGIKFKGDTIPRIFYVADVALSSSVISKDELFIFLIEKGFVLFFPMEGKDHYRVIGILPDKIDADFTFHEIEDSIKNFVRVPLTFTELFWFSSYKVHSRMAEKFMNGNCFLAGDAAHIHSPAGGQGMNTGIQDAYNLAWKMALVLKKQAAASLLETFNTERTANAVNLLNSTDRMFDVMTGTGWLLNFFRLQVIPVIAGYVLRSSYFNQRVFPFLSQIAISYPESALTVKSNIGKIHAGDRMPYFILENGKNIFDYLRKPMFKILYFGSNSKELTMNDKISIPFEYHSFNEIPVKYFGKAKDFYIVLRPDNHVTYIGTSLSFAISHLEKFSVKAEEEQL